MPNQLELFILGSLVSCGFVVVPGGRHRLELEVFGEGAGFKEGLQELQNRRPIKAILMGTRDLDPNAVRLWHLLPVKRQKHLMQCCSAR